MFWDYECGNCESTPCACELEEPTVQSRNLYPTQDYSNMHQADVKLKKGKYYKRMGWFNRAETKDLFFVYNGSGNARYVRRFKKEIYTDKVDTQVLLSDDLVEVDSNGELLAAQPEEVIMSKNYIGGNYYYVGVRHNVNSKDIFITNPYIYKCDISNGTTPDVQVGDMVVVENSKCYKLGIVTDVYTDSFQNAAIAKQATAWVVDKVDMARHLKKVEATVRRDYLLTKLNERQEQIQATQMYALLAQVDPEAKKLLEELTELSK